MQFKYRNFAVFAKNQLAYLRIEREITFLSISINHFSLLIRYKNSFANGDKFNLGFFIKIFYILHNFIFIICFDSVEKYYFQSNFFYVNSETNKDAFHRSVKRNKNSFIFFSWFYRDF